jgi:hypothetical protein
MAESRQYKPNKQRLELETKPKQFQNQFNWRKQNSGSSKTTNANKDNLNNSPISESTNLGRIQW